MRVNCADEMVVLCMVFGIFNLYSQDEDLTITDFRRDGEFADQLHCVASHAEPCRNRTRVEAHTALRPQYWYGMVWYGRQ